MRITIGGEVATGKSSVARALAERLGLSAISVGKNFIQKYAKDKSVTIEELGKHFDMRDVDLSADNWAHNVGLEEDNFVFEGQMTWMTVDHADLKVLLTCGIGMRAHRRSFQKNIGFEKARQQILEQDKNDRQRFKTDYPDIEDFLDPAHYDVVIDTHALNIGEVVDQIVQHVSSVAVAV